MICVFCGHKATATREHVLPQWLGSLPPGEGPFVINRIDETGRTVQYRSSGVDIVARVVCGGCNHGWMADLEAAASPLLSPLINGESLAMPPDAQDLVSRWAVKTAIMFLYATQPPVGASSEHRASLFGGQIPANTGIWLGKHRLRRPAYNSWIRARQIEMRLARAEEIHVGLSVTLTVGYYVQQVLLTPYQWFGRSFHFRAPAALRRKFLLVPGDRTVRWPPYGSVSISELERHADAFGAEGINTPLSETDSH